MRAYGWMLVAVVTGLAVPASAQDSLPVEGSSALPHNFRLPIYNPQPGGPTTVGLDTWVGPDATDKGTKLLLLSFSASYCPPCIKELPYLEGLHQRYKDFGLRVAVVSIDSKPEGQQAMAALVEKTKVTLPVLKDRFNIPARKWLGPQALLPSVFLVKPDGTVQLVKRGYTDEVAEVLSAEVEAALGIKRGSLRPVVADATPAPGTVAPAAAPTTAPTKAPAKKSKRARRGTTGTATAAPAQP